MSAKGRGVEPVESDYYPTPAWVVDRLLDRHAVELGFGRRANALRVLEPTVGDGAIVRAVDGWIARTPHFETERTWTGVELRSGALLADTQIEHHFDGVDFLRWGFDLPKVCGVYPEDVLLPFNIAIGNPPFSLAEPIIRHALGMCDVVCMLLRVGFLGSEERVPFWQGVGKGVALRILPNRPSFDGVGTDSADYAWFIWGCPGVTGVDVLDLTSKEVRKAQKPSGRGQPFVEPRQGSLFDAQ